MSGGDSRGRSSAGDTRGQTLPDFTVAIAIFLATIAFITLFVPQITQPFDDQEQPVVAERITSELGGDELVVEESSSQLDEDATIQFFDGADSGQDVLDEVGIRKTYSVNVTIRDAPSQAAGSDILCDDGGEISSECGSGDRLAIGSELPADGQSVATTRRTLFVGDRDVVLEVGVW